MNWDEAVDKVSPYICKIETPMGHGTGFLCLYNQDKSICGIATALHVVFHADDWQQPIRVRHEQSGREVLFGEKDRYIFKDWRTDSAVIVFPKGEWPLPNELIPLLPMGNALGIGVEVGWLGFPAIEPWTLCFFSGNISAWNASRKAYFIDGVAINGVSGGPVMYFSETEGTQVVGIISAYKANRASGEALPGLSLAQDVSHFHDVINHIRSIDEAQKKKEEFEKSRRVGAAEQMGPQPDNRDGGAPMPGKDEKKGGCP